MHMGDLSGSIEGSNVLKTLCILSVLTTLDGVWRSKQQQSNVLLWAYFSTPTCTQDILLIFDPSDFEISQPFLTKPLLSASDPLIKTVTLQLSHIIPQKNEPTDPDVDH